MRRFAAFSPRPELRLAGLALALVVYVGCFEALHHLFYAHGVLTDLPVYTTYGEAMAHGQLPYRDFALEYPPGALPPMLVPALLPWGYGTVFWWLMAGCGVATVVVFALCRPSPWAVGLLALSPLLLGSYLPTRFDLWPTLLMVGGIAALLRDRHRLGFAALAGAVAAKLFPAVLLPLAAVWTWRRAGRAELARALGAGVVVLAAAFGPFAVLAPHGLWESVWGQLSRPLQIESLAAAFLMTFGRPTVIASHGSLSLAGHGALAAASALVSWAAIVAVWVWFARGEAERERFLRACAAAVCAFVAFGKVLSPQFQIWLVPLVLLVRGRRGLAAAGLLVAALIDTLVWFPGRYWPYVYHARLAWLVLARDLLLVALFLVLSLPAGAALRSAWRARPARTRRPRPRFARPRRPPRADPGIP